MKKRLLAILLASAMVVCMMPTMAFADEVVAEEQATQVEETTAVEEVVEEATEEVAEEVAEEEAVVEEEPQAAEVVAKGLDEVVAVEDLVYNGHRQQLVKFQKKALKGKGDKSAQPKGSYFKMKTVKHGKEVWVEIKDVKDVVAVDAGEYEIKYYASKDAKAVELTGVIAAKEVEVEWTLPGDETDGAFYTGEAQKAEAVAQVNDILYLPLKLVVLQGDKDCVDAGTYTVAAYIDQYKLAPWVKASNYELTDSVVRYQIKKAPVFAVWEDTTVEYNGEVQKPYATIQNNFTDEEWATEVSVSYGLLDVDAILAGKYTASVDEIYGVSKSDLKNYDFGFNYFNVGNMVTPFEITKKLVTITANDVERLYKEEDPEFSYTAEGFVGQEALIAEILLDDVVEYVTEVEYDTEVGTYALTPEFVDDFCLLHQVEYQLLNLNYYYEFEDGTFTVSPHDYNVIVGVAQKYFKGTKGGAVFVCDGRFDLFTGLKVDGKALVEGKDYTVKEGSTIATLTEAYANKLAVGQHKITFQYEDGEVSAPFTVAASPNTADANDLAPFAVMLMIAVLGLAGVSLKNNR